MPDLPSAGPGLPSLPHADLGEFAVGYPRLAEWWGSSSWSDGSDKKPAVVRLSLYMGKPWVQMSILGTGLMLRAQLPDPRLWADALEALLATSPVPFEKDPWNPKDPPGGEKKGKKG